MIPLNHTGTAAQTALITSIDETIATITVKQLVADAWPNATFVITVDRGSPSEEKMLVTWVSTDRTTFTVERGFDGTAALSHNNDAVVEHTISAAEMQWLSEHINSSTGHGLSSPIVGVDDPQTLKNKVIDDVNNDISITTNSILNYNTQVAARDANFVKRNSPVVGNIRIPNETGVPTGSIILWAGPSSSVPTGWLRCDGSSLSQLGYAELYAVIGNTYTSSPNMETFQLPNLTPLEPQYLNYVIFDGIGGI